MTYCYGAKFKHNHTLHLCVTDDDTGPLVLSNMNVPIGIYQESSCLNSLCSVSHSQASTQIPNPYHTVTAYDRVTSRYLY